MSAENNFIVRDFAKRDIPAVIDLEQRNFSDPWSESVFAEELDNPNGVTLVAEHEGTVIGYINAHHVFENAHINTFCVKETARKKGVGTLLLTKLQQIVSEAGAEELTLEVREHGVAVPLYHSFGFESVGRRKQFYRNPSDDALIMKKELIG